MHCASYCATKIRKYGKEISIEQLPARLPASHKMLTRIDQLTKRKRAYQTKTQTYRLYRERQSMLVKPTISIAAVSIKVGRIKPELRHLG